MPITEENRQARVNVRMLEENIEIRGGLNAEYCRFTDLLYENYYILRKWEQTYAKSATISDH